MRSMTTNRIILVLLSVVLILPLYGFCINYIFDLECFDRSYGGDFLLWGIIGFFLAMICVYLIKKGSKQDEPWKNGWGYLFYQLYLFIAGVLVSIIITMLIILAVIFGLADGFPSFG
jgi:hypothetical protein